MSLRSPLGRALGRGAAGEGTGHWWLQRVTAIALIPLCLWFFVGLLRRHAGMYVEVYDWLSRPWPALLAMLLVVSLAWHSKLGIEVVVEDYVQAKGAKTAVLLLSTFLHVLAAFAGAFALLRMALSS